MVNRTEEILSGTQQQNKLNYLQNRFTPYFIILLFTAAITVLRLFMIDEWPMWKQLLAFCNQTVVMIGIWHLVKFLNRKLDKRMPFETGPLRRMFFQITLTIIIVAPLLVIAAYLARPFIPSFVNKQFLMVCVVLFVLMMALFNFSFYAGYFFRNWQESIEARARLEVQAAELEKEKFNLQYHQLRNQVNPHYLFNTLSSLDGLIQINPELASEFVQHMAKVYRYVLQHKQNEVVSLEEEIRFIDHYVELLNIRYAKGLDVRCTISEAAKDKGIVMVTIQMLIDNAIKHNVVKAEQPLQIVIRDSGDHLVVSNSKQLRGQIETSNGQGLQQLKQLYAYHTGREIIIETNEEQFTIRIPLL